MHPQFRISRPRLVLVTVVCTLICAVAALIAFAHRPSQQATDALSRTNNSLAKEGRGAAESHTTALRGEDAISHLKQEGTYESLGNALAAAEYSINPVPHTSSPNDERAYEAGNTAQSMRAVFTRDGVRVHSSGEQKWQVGLKLKGYGYGNNLLGVVSGEMKAQGNRIEISKQSSIGAQSSSLTEWYENKPEGLEQGFTLNAPPVVDSPKMARAHGRLRVAMTMTGDLHGGATKDGQTVWLLDQHGQQVVNYGHLRAWDATGRELAAQMHVRGREVALEVDAAGASYPVTIDPLLWQQQAQLLAGGGLPFDLFGWSVAVSGDTAIVGAREDNPRAARQGGSAYVFVRSHGAWTQQQKLVGGQSNAFHRFGESVAIDGNTAVVGAIGEDVNVTNQGAAHVFVRSGGVWSEQQNLFAADAQGAGYGQLGENFGSSVAISGNTIIVGTFGHGAYIFARSNGVWMQQDEKLVNSNPVNGDLFGFRVAISGDTAIVGAPGDIKEQVTTGFSYSKGSASIYVRSGGMWSLQQKLEGSVFGDRFGVSVGISGETVVVGINNLKYQNNDGTPTPENLLRQFVYVYVRGSDGVWSPQQTLIADGDHGSSPGDDFGAGGLAISGDTVIVGAPGKKTNPSGGNEGVAYIFVPINGAWSQERRLTSSDSASGDEFGNSVAVSGTTVVVGAYAHTVTQTDQGAAYVFLRSQDTDGDGLPDDWETNGVTIDGEFINLPKMGANPMHKDIFVHADWMEPSPAGVVFKPSPRAIKMVSDAFAVAPVQNPDGKPGVNLHVDLGKESIMNPRTGATWDDLSQTVQVPFKASLGSNDPDGEYNWSTIDAIKKAGHFSASKRRAVFRYALFCNTFANAPNTGLARDIPGNDFLVSLGAYQSRPGGTVLVQAGTFMHELGHTLGLGHGGGDDINLKPNYLSVMNYSFQFLGLLSPDGKQRQIDYSHLKLPTLDENDLDENVGISDPAGHLTLWSRLTRTDTLSSPNKCLDNFDFYNRLFYPSRALDWNCDGARTPTHVAADINRDSICVTAGANSFLDTNPENDDVVIGENILAGPDRQCDTTAIGDDNQEHKVGYIQPDLLVGFADWPALVYEGTGSIGNFGATDSGSMTTPNNEPTIKQILEVAPLALLNEELVAPLDNVTLSMQTGHTPLTVNFDGSASTAVNGTIVNWAWDFGDGTTGTGATVTHTYNTPGDYYASLTVTDNNGRVNLVPLLNLVTVTDQLPPTLSINDVTVTEGNTGTTPATFNVTLSRASTQTVTVNFATSNGSAEFGGDYQRANGTVTFNSGETAKTITVLVNGDTLFEPDETFYVTLSNAVNAPLGRAQGTATIINDDAAPTATPTPVPTPTAMLNVGDVDSSFNATVTKYGGRTFNGNPINAVVTQPDGRVIVGGAFESFAGCARRNIVRINADGSCDPSFDSGLVLTDVLSSNKTPESKFRQDLQVQALVLQPDGKILVGLMGVRGFENGISRASKGILRLNTDGTLDSSFDATGDFLDSYVGNTGVTIRPSVQVRTIALQPDGKIIIGGSFAASNNGRHDDIARLNADGSIDSSFVGGLGYLRPTQDFEHDSYRALALQPDGKIILGGLFFENSYTSTPVLRVNSDGSLDTTFNRKDTSTNVFACRFGFASFINALALQPDGKVIVGGNLFRATASDANSFVARLNTDGSRDNFANFTFGDSNYINGGITGFALQTDGKVIAAGDFEIGGQPPTSHGVVRLNADGTIDTSYDVGLGTMEAPGDAARNQKAVLAVALQSDGKAVIGGYFDHFNGHLTEGIAQINPDGSRDQAFDSNGPGINAQVSALVRQPDNKLLVGFRPTLSGGRNGDSPRGKLNSTRLGGIGRLNPDGTTDTTFTSPFDDGSDVGYIVLQSDGKIIIGGSVRLIGDISGNIISFTRLNANGTLDATFHPPTSANGRAIIQPDGKILVAGFSANGTPGLVRLNSDGSYDNTFSTFFPNGVSPVALQPDGRIIILVTGRNFRPSQIARLNADGSTDTTFDPGTGPDNSVRAVILQPDGKILIGGDFFNYNGTARDCMARLNADGSLDTSFVPVNPNTYTYLDGGQSHPKVVYSLALQPDGKIFVGGYSASDLYQVATPTRVFRLNTDGSLDSSFPLGTGLEGINLYVNALLLQPDGQLIIGGDFYIVNSAAHLALARLIATTTPASAPTPTPTLLPTPSPAPTPTPTYTISGRVTSNDNGLGNVTVTLSDGASATTATDASGNYSFTNLASSGNYTVTPAKTNYGFTPPSSSISNLSGDQTNVNFTATLQTGTISGQVTSGVTGLSGVFITLGGDANAQATTNSNGNYSIVNVPVGANITITPSRNNYTFAPTSTVVNNLRGNQTANFAATLQTYAISGRITTGGTTGLGGITVTLDGSQSATAQTDANGNYSFANLASGGSYSITPAKANYAFTLPSQSISYLSGNKTNINFAAQLVTYTIGGQVTSGNSGLGAVTVALSGSQTGSTATDANGNYSFTVNAGGNYTLTPARQTYTFNPPSQSFGNLSNNQTANFMAMPTPTPTPIPTPSATPVFTPSPTPAPTIQFSAGTYTVDEAGTVDAQGRQFDSVSITVIRSGDASGAASVDYLASDGTALQKSDYEFASGTLSFAAGETTKTFDVLIVNDVYKEGNETVNLLLSNASGATLSAQKTAVLTIRDDDTTTPTTNPIDVTRFFVRMQYLDFLDREGDTGGYDYWTNAITQCGTDQACLNRQRVAVSAAFFIEQEFQDTGSFIYRLNKASFGTRVSYMDFSLDRGRVVGGTQLEASKAALAEDFVQRSNFITKYPFSQSGVDFVDALLKTIKDSSNVNLMAKRSEILGEYNNGGGTQAQSRARALRKVIDYAEYTSAEFNRAFVLAEYFGYLRRDPDEDGYNFWLDVLNNRVPGNYRSMVCAFSTSAEYQDRFSPVRTKNDSICSDAGN